MGYAQTGRTPRQSPSSPGKYKVVPTYEYPPGPEAPDSELGYGPQRLLKQNGET
jgi:hypothetical protein